MEYFFEGSPPLKIGFMKINEEEKICMVLTLSLCGKCTKCLKMEQFLQENVTHRHLIIEETLCLNGDLIFKEVLNDWALNVFMNYIFYLL